VNFMYVFIKFDSIKKRVQLTQFFQNDQMQLKFSFTSFLDSILFALRFTSANMSLQCCSPTCFSQKYVSYLTAGDAVRLNYNEPSVWISEEDNNHSKQIV
jgi:hypothetical protein